MGIICGNFHDVQDRARFTNELIWYVDHCQFFPIAESRRRAHCCFRGGVAGRLSMLLGEVASFSLERNLSPEKRLVGAPDRHQPKTLPTVHH